MTAGLEGQRILITGAGRGLGRAVAVGMAREGASLWICDRTEDELAGTVECIRATGAPVRSFRFDLGREEACRELVDRLRAETKIDCAINNAAVLPITPIAETTIEEWRETLSINLTAPFLITQGLLPPMRDEGGSVINLSSRAGIRGSAREAAYCASKFGIEGFTKAVAVELAGEPVSINTITPGRHIKPTMMTDEQEQALAPEERSWESGASLLPAFVYLARARGAPSGLRFDAERLTRLVEERGVDLDPRLAEEVAE